MTRRPRPFPSAAPASVPAAAPAFGLLLLAGLAACGQTGETPGGIPAPAVRTAPPRVLPPTPPIFEQPAPAGAPCAETDPCWKLTITNPTATRIWGSSANDVWAVGSDGLLLNWNGTAWRRFPTPTNSTLLAVWGSSGSNVWAVGTDSALLRWNGATWSRIVGGAIPPGVALNDVWGSSSSDVWVVGDQGVVLRYNGAVWSSLPLPYVNNLHTVWAQSPTSAWLGGDLGLLLRWNGTALTEVPSSTTETINMIRGNPGTGTAYMTIGTYGLLRIWNGTAWGGWMSDRTVTELQVMGDGTMIAMNAGAHFAWSGTSWGTAYPFNTGSGVTSFWMASTSEGWATGDSALIRWTGTFWQRRW